MSPETTTEIPQPDVDLFDAALAGASTRLQLEDGRDLPLPTRRWHAPADSVDQWLLRRCHGPTLDLGCGPGRLVQALQHAGTPALGVDCSALAVRRCVARGVPVLHRDVFDPLPAEGTWDHVLLADGNIGIGGNPAALLRRATSLLRLGGSVLVETAPAHAGAWCGRARLRHTDRGTGPWFPWAVLGLNAVRDLVRHIGLHVIDVRHGYRRCFVQLAPGPTGDPQGRGVLRSAGG